MALSSRFSAKTLKYYYGRIQEIANVAGAEGIQETEELIWELHFSGILEPFAPREKNLIEESEFVKYFNWQIQDSEELLQRNMEVEYERLEKLEHKLTNNEHRQPGTIEWFKRDLEYFISRGRYDNNIVSKRSADIVVAYIDRAKKAVELAEQAEPFAHDHVIDFWAKYVHDHGGTAHRTISEARDAEAYFQKNGILTEERLEKINSVKINAATYLPRKSLLGSLEAQRKGNSAKSIKLKNEATYYLNSYWEYAFPRQEVPSIESLLYNINNEDNNRYKHLMASIMSAYVNNK